MADKIMDARRAKFEQWFTETYTAHKLSPRLTNCGIVTDGYSDSRVDLCWRGYNAALDSLCVELPFETHGNMAASEVIEAIHAAGVKTK